MPPLSRPTFVKTTSVDDLNEKLGAYLFAESQSAIQAHGKFVFATSGGSLPKAFVSSLTWAVTAGLDLRTDLWHVFYADERHVPLDDPESNHAATLEGLRAAPWWKATLHPINPTLALEACAAAYQAEVEGCVTRGVFDLVLLGMGPDGHTASLFPGHPLLLHPTPGVVAISDSPKPPPCRVTLTLPTINASRAVAFVALGEGKAQKLAAIAAGGPAALAIPSALVRQEGGGATWFLDTGSASLLPR